MVQVIYPGVPKIITVVVLSGQVTGSAAHGMGGTPQCGKPNPDKQDSAANTAYATADDTTITVTTEVPVSSNVTFKVMVMI